MRRAARRDSNEAELVKMARTLGCMWVPGPPLDGWAWSSRHLRWYPVEIKLPSRAGSKNEYTEAQKKFFWTCGASGAQWWTWRDSSDVLKFAQERD